MQNKNNSRYNLLDSLRGFVIINMIFYHFLFDIFVIYNYNYGWTNNKYAYLWQQFISCSFIIIAGMSWNFSKKNLKRGIMIFILGLVITLVSYIIIPKEMIIWNILNLIGLAILLMIPLNKCFKYINPYLGFIVSLTLFILGKIMPNYNANIKNIISIPKKTDIFLDILGFPNKGFASSDYFPIIPWLFLFITGYFLCKILMRYECSKKILKIELPFLTSIGKKSLIIYFLHQPIILLILAIFFNLRRQ